MKKVVVVIEPGYVHKQREEDIIYMNVWEADHMGIKSGETVDMTISVPNVERNMSSEKGETMQDIIVELMQEAYARGICETSGDFTRIKTLEDNKQRWIDLIPIHWSNVFITATQKAEED